MIPGYLQFIERSTAFHAEVKTCTTQSEEISDVYICECFWLSFLRLALFLQVTANPIPECLPFPRVALTRLHNTTGN